MKKDSIHIVDTRAEEMTAALSEGKIDAAVTWNPLLTEQRKMLGDNATILTNDRIYKLYWTVLAARDFATRIPKRSENFCGHS